jgi:gluconolactonase
VFVQLSGGLAGPDGLALDEDGNLAVAHAGLGTVWLFSRLGEPVARVKSCAGVMTTNVAYGGADRRTLYITESETGSVLAADMPVAGRPMYG